MGFRFRKSFKIAPGVKFNVNKKSVGMTFGIKGAHYTINSKGKRTKSVGIRGTGISYTTSSGGETSGNSNNEGGNNASNMNNKKGGCLSICVMLLLISLALALYSFAWIPAIGALIYFAISKKHRDNRTRNVIASIAVIITSLAVCVWLGNSPDLISADAKWDSTEYDISEEATVIFDLNPSDAKIDSIELIDNDIATMTRNGDAAVVTFKNLGTEQLAFKVNGIETSKEEITVIDREAEKLAEKKAEEERIAAEKAEQERLAAEQAEQERIAAEQAAQQQAAEQQAAEQAAVQQQTQNSYVLNTSTMKFHHLSCRDVSKISPQNYGEYTGTRDDIISQGYSPCGHCNP